MLHITSSWERNTIQRLRSECQELKLTPKAGTQYDFLLTFSTSTKDGHHAMQLSKESLLVIPLSRFSSFQLAVYTLRYYLSNITRDLF